MPNDFLALADKVAENYSANPFSKWIFKLQVVDGGSNEVAYQHIRHVSGTEYAHTLFEDIKAVLEGEKDIAD